MATETVRALEPQTLELFAAKRTQGGPEVLQVGNANGVSTCDANHI